MYESSDLPFFKSTFRIYLGSDALEESMTVKTFLTILGVIETFSSLRLVLERETDRDHLNHQG